MILIILKSLTILTALVAALEALLWLASWVTEEDVVVSKISSVMKLTSKIMEIVEMMSRKKKKDKKYLSTTKQLRMIYTAKMLIIMRLTMSNPISTLASKMAVLKSSEKRE